MEKIILDTNSLMAIAELKIDLFTELEQCCDFVYEINVLSGTVKELDKIMTEQRLKYRRIAQLALGMIKVKGVKEIPSTGYVDDDLVEMSERGYIVLTQDKELKSRLARPYLTIRQRKRVVLIK